MIVQTNHLNLLRKISWSFNHTTGIDYEELYSEALLSYCVAQQKYEKKYNVPFHKYLSMVVNRALINFVTKANKAKYMPDDFTAPISILNSIPFFEIYEALTEDCKVVVDMILEDPHEYLGCPAKMARGEIVKQIREEYNWTWNRIWGTIRDLKDAVNQSR